MQKVVGSNPISRLASPVSSVYSPGHGGIGGPRDRRQPESAERGGRAPLQLADRGLCAVRDHFALLLARQFPAGQLDWAALILFGGMLICGLVDDRAESWLMENANLMREVERMVRQSKQGVSPSNVITAPFLPARP